MPLTLITGTANAGKTGLIYAEIRSAMAAGRGPVLIVPSEPDAERASKELSGDFPVGTRVTTFDRFVTQLWNAIGDGREIVTAPRRALLSAAAARECGQSGGMAQLCEQCAVLLAEQTGTAWRAREPSAVPPVGRGLEGMLRAYARLLGELDLLEPAEATYLLPDFRPDYGRALLLHRFADFTASQEALIRDWAQHGDVWVSLTWRESFAPTAASNDLVQRLAPDEHRIARDEQRTDPTLGAVAEGLFDAPAKHSASPSLRFSLAEGSESEAVRIAQEVKQAILENVASNNGEIAVVFRDVEAHYPALKQAFSEAGIEADYDVRIPFTKVAFGSALTHALTYALTGDRAQLLALLRSPFSGIEISIVRRLERDWRRHGITARSELVRQIEHECAPLGAVLDAVLAAASEPVDAASVRRIAQATRQLFALRYGQKGTTARPGQEMDSWAHAASLTLMSDVAKLVPGRLGLADIRDALAVQVVGPKQAERETHVQVTSATRIRGRRFETVILGGLNTGEFPHRSQETLLPGTAAEAVVRAFGGSGERAGAIEYEQLLFYLVVSRARRRLVLSAQTTDSDGEPRSVSPFFEAVCDNFRDSEDDRWPQHAFRALSEAPKLDSVLSGREFLRAQAFAGNKRVPRVTSAATRAVSRGGLIQDPSVLRQMAERDVFSVSELENYLDCPYKWFYQRAVRAQELERSSGPADQGEFAHELLRRTYETLLLQGIARVSEPTLGLALSVLDAAFEKCLSEREGRVTVEERIAKATAKHWAARIISDDVTFLPGFCPALLEWPFGVVTPVQIGSFSVRGRVDRIDVDLEGRAVVTDYKSSKVFSAAKMISEGKVQIPIYLAVVEQELSHAPGGGLYRCLKKRDNRGVVLDDVARGDFVRHDVKGSDDFLAIISQGVALAEEAVDGIRQGVITPEPRTTDSCTYCKARLSCAVSA